MSPTVLEDGDFADVSGVAIARRAGAAGRGRGPPHAPRGGSARPTAGPDRAAGALPRCGRGQAPPSHLARLDVAPRPTPPRRDRSGYWADWDCWTAVVRRDCCPRTPRATDQRTEGTSQPQSTHVGAGMQRMYQKLPFVHRATGVYDGASSAFHRHPDASAPRHRGQRPRPPIFSARQGFVEDYGGNRHRHQRHDVRVHRGMAAADLPHGGVPNDVCRDQGEERRVDDSRPCRRPTRPEGPRHAATAARTARTQRANRHRQAGDEHRRVARRAAARVPTV